MDYERAKACRNWFREEFIVPENWSENTFADHPEQTVDETNNWFIAEYYHDNLDISISIEARSQKTGLEAIAWIEGGDVSREQLRFSINGGMGTAMAAQLNDEDVDEAVEEARPKQEIHRLAERMIELDQTHR